MSVLGDSIAFVMNKARRALGSDDPHEHAAAASMLANTRDLTRRVCHEHDEAMRELLVIVREATPLTIERRLEILALANRMRATAQLPPVLMEIAS